MRPRMELALRENIMKRLPLSSSCLASVGHDAKRHVLEVEFKNGGLYHYLGVPLWVKQGLLRADSHGTYFNAEIRNRYPFVMIRKPQRGRF